MSSFGLSVCLPVCLSACHSAFIRLSVRFSLSLSIVRPAADTMPGPVDISQLSLDRLSPAHIRLQIVSQTQVNPDRDICSHCNTINNNDRKEVAATCCSMSLLMICDTSWRPHTPPCQPPQLANRRAIVANSSKENYETDVWLRLP